MKTDLPVIASLLHDVAVTHGGSWEGGPVDAQQAMIHVAGPDRIGAIPITRPAVARALDSLAAGAAPADLRVRRLGYESRWSLEAEARPDGQSATVIDAWISPDGGLIVHARCDACGADVLHGAGTDLSDPLLGHRVAHCPCASYVLVDPRGVTTSDVLTVRA
jgi:hypothetical protein